MQLLRAQLNPTGFGLIGRPLRGSWSHFELIKHPKQAGAILIVVSGDQAKNFAYECLAEIKNHLPLQAEALYQKLESLLKEAQSNQYQLEFGLILTEGRKIILATQGVGIYLERSGKRGNLLKPLDKLQLIKGVRHPNDLCFFYTRGAKKTIFQLHQLENPWKKSSVQTNSILQSIHDSDVALGIFSFNQDLTETVAEIMGEQGLISEIDDTQAKVLPTTSVESLVSEAQPASTQSQKNKVGLYAITKKVSTGLALFLIKILAVFPKLIGYFKNIRISRPKVRSFSWWFGSKQVYLDQNLARASLKKISIVFAAVSVLAISLGIILFRQYQMRVNVDQVLQPLREKLQTAYAVSTDQPVLAKKQVTDLTKDLLVLKDDLTTTEYGQEQFDSFYATLNQYLDSIADRELKQVPIFDDLRTYASTFVVTHLGLDGQSVVFADAQQQLIIFYQLQEKITKLLSLESPIEIKAVVADALDSALILEKGVTSIKYDQDAAEITNVIAEGDSNQSGTLLAGFQTNLYVFNPDRRNIFRYVEGGNGYSNPVGWFAQPVGFDFNSITSMMVDGDVWLGTNQGEILKFSGGRQSEFALSEFSQVFNSTLQLATAPDHPYIYALESAQNRVVVLDKQGKFVTQTVSPLLGTATHLLFSQPLNLLLAVSGSVLYQIPL
ncbi:MAG TPA: hypothetical protein PKX78_00300 [Candidatus Woesebacteria bacterium]|nr:hypothetical protein [Candidatus Woesebacteria bacterium]